MAGVIGILVAGGEGRRLGLAGAKALAPLEGRTLLERALGVLESVCEAIVVTQSPRRPLGFDFAAHPRVSVASDAPGTAGPLAGLVAGMNALPFETALVLGVDFPLVSSEALRALIAMLGESSAVVPAPAGLPQPLCAVFATASRDALARSLAHGERSLIQAVMSIAPRLLRDDEIARLPGGAHNFFNVNTPADLEDATRLLRAGAGSGSVA
jgi:molybdopterin-guanine dinucleotide biosynthesis protein A